ncbi:MAG: ubiquinol-cytochrome c reductase iron-sulfur subunit [Steroidobacterales bacterium]
MTDIGAIAAGPDELDESRRKFLIYATGGTAVIGAVLAAAPFVASWEPSERAKALGAPVEVPIDSLKVGQLITATWRKQVIYIVRRSQEMVATLGAIDSRLKDPQSNSSEQPDYARNQMRSRRADVLVLIGFCTHLGCLPKQKFQAGDATLGADWPGGFRCPCHGSRFDMAGRVFDGSPASTNLRIPPYSFRAENTLIIGLDNPTQGAA